MFGNSSDEPETKKREEERTLSTEFTRKTVEFQFVRGSTDTVTFDEVNMRAGPRSRTRVDDGIYETQRNGLAVERFYRVRDAHSLKEGGKGSILRLYAEYTGVEVTTGNVARRKVIDETEMVVEQTVNETVKTNVETGDVVSRGVPEDVGEAEIKEVDGEE